MGCIYRARKIYVPIRFLYHTIQKCYEQLCIIYLDLQLFPCSYSNYSIHNWSTCVYGCVYQFLHTPSLPFNHPGYMHITINRPIQLGQCRRSTTLCNAIPYTMQFQIRMPKRLASFIIPFPTPIWISLQHRIIYIIRLAMPHCQPTRLVSKLNGPLRLFCR